MTLVDMPGVGESAERDEEYRNLYRDWIDRIDVALWLIKVDDRVLGPDEDYFERVIKPSGFAIDRIVFVISQVEKTDSMWDWNRSHGRPGGAQIKNIEEKILHIQKAFSAPAAQIVPVSADERYNLIPLAERIVDACPPEAALNVAKALSKDLRSETVRQSVISKVWSAISGFYQRNSEQIHAILVDFVTSLIVKAFRRKDAKG